MINMRKGFMYLELLLTIALAALLVLLIMNWFRGYLTAAKHSVDYYRDRNALVNKVGSGEGQVIAVTHNVTLKRVSVNNLTLEYFDN